MKFKKTRFVFSVFFGMLTLFLIGLWVRSYWWGDAIAGATPQRSYWFHSDCGCLMLNMVERSQIPRRWSYISGSSSHGIGGGYGPPPIAKPQFSSQNTSLGYVTILSLPIWIAVICMSLVGCAPWLFAFPWSKQFSLRTLLIFITLVGTVLGLIMYFARA